jgi:RimJ/RimL family protein N-acetyltransferase
LTILTTARLRLEPFDDAHLDGLHAMGRLPEVMQYITGRPETREETQAAIERVKARWAGWGYSWWAFIDPLRNRVAGAGCIQHLGRETHHPLEIGWRLHPDYWGQGLASEAAVAMATFAFDRLAAPVLLAVRHPANEASAKVMERLGMRYRGMEAWYDTQVAVHELTAAEWAVRHPASG